MSRILLSASALAVVVTAFSAAPADARRHHYRHSTYYGQKVCRRSKGSAGLIAGGVGGALVGRSILGHGLLGTAGGAVGGALAGRAIDRSLTANRRCYYR
ncbi:MULTISPECIES: hypothetical protein [Sphingomonas]|uniref:hypothetical protein n=1 Tax=Sphingomonas TaxID=13687 RepID=UPI000DEF03B6|nr:MULTISPECIES: hypothetical protein [Sphingomonas]